MPELPDLQAFTHNLNKTIAGKTVEKAKLSSKKSDLTEKELKKAIEGNTIKKVHRVGKELHIEFKDGIILGLHLMLNGELSFFENTNTKKSTVLELTFADGTGLAMSDWRSLAKVALNPELRDSPDALSDEVDYKFLKEKLKSKRKNIKEMLMDQKFIMGIGNAYVDEILWDARISPGSVSNKIPDEKLKDLAKSIKSVLKDAEKQILKTDPDIITGEVRGFLKIHNSKKKKSPTGAEILHTQAGGRRTYYTEEQEEFK
jgi:formamidopyrimidine-DNA glycosylase